MVSDFLDELGEATKKHLTQSIDIATASTFPTPGQLPLEKPRWRKIENAVVVATDLKGSTAISYSKQAGSARGYTTRRRAVACGW